MTPPRQWKRVSPDHPCAVCGKADWCGFSEDGTFAVCMRVQEGSLKPTSNGGYLHRLADDDHQAGRPRVFSRTVRMKPAAPGKDWSGLLARCRQALPAERLDNLAARLGLTGDVLARFGCGWSSWHGAYTFPMHDAQGNVIGVHLRRPGGSKLCVTGSKLGLFVPDDPQVVPGGRLVITEGLTDAAALAQMKFSWVIGRPSCSAAVKLLVGYVQLHRPNDVAVVATATRTRPASAGRSASRPS